MPRLQTLMVMFFLNALSAAANQNVEVGKVYQVRGNLSSDLQLPPTLDTTSIAEGLALKITLQTEPAQDLALFALRSKPISATIRIISKEGTRNFTAKLISSEIAAPDLVFGTRQ